MAKHLETGRKGEELALEFLEKEGFLLVERNWKYGRKEIDLIMMDKDVLVFVEVKAKSSPEYGWPERAVNFAKKNNIAKVADEYLYMVNNQKDIRFDVISILFYPDKTDIFHIRDAFVPGRE